MRRTIERRYGSDGDTSPPPRSLLLPKDSVIDVMNDSQILELYWRYINTLQVLCRNQTRFGSLGDGGKEICVDNLYKPKGTCLVYSFGSGFKFDFEEAIIHQFRCEVHTFDPSKPLGGHRIPDGVTFHLTGLSNRTHINKNNWKMSSLSDIRKSLNQENRTIDILKIDIEGGEWVALPQIFSSGVLKDVKQVSIEVHFYTGTGWNPDQQLKTLRTFYDAGFRIFMHEHVFSNKIRLSKHLIICKQNEISLINVNWKDRKSVV